MNYVAIGAVFPTSIKGQAHPTRRTGVRARGCGARRAPREAVVAIGGITLETAPTVIDAGAASVAVISDLLAGDPAERAPSVRVRPWDVSGRTGRGLTL